MSYLDAARRMPTRPVEARLAGWPYKPFGGDFRVAGDSPRRTRGTEVAAVAGNGGTDSHAAGLEQLLASRYDAAVDALHRAAEQQPKNAAYWNDLSAARLARARHNDDASELADALADADHALRLDPHSTDAAFNRGLALESLHLDAAAAKAYLSMRTYEPADSGWLAEATSRAAKLHHEPRERIWAREKPRLARAAKAGDERTIDDIVGRFAQEARTTSELFTMRVWGEAVSHGDAAAAGDALQLARAVGASLVRLHGDELLRDAVQAAEETQFDASGSHERAQPLAQAYSAYYDGRVAFAHREVTRSIPLFERAAADFAAARSPMAEVAAYYLASARCDANDTVRASADLRDLAARVPARYRALHAQMEWEMATGAANGGEIYTELRHSKTALRGFEELGEFENTLMMRASVSSVLGRLGSDAQSWRLAKQVFAATSESASEPRLQITINATARQALESSRWDIARSILSVGIDASRANARLYVSYLVSRAVAAWRGGDDPAADLDAASEALPAIADAALRNAAAAELNLARAAIVVKADPRSALALASASIEFAASRGRTIDLPLALLERARAKRALHEFDAAVSDLEQSAALLEARRSGIADADVRDTFLASHSDLFEELAAAHAERGEAPQAFRAAERLRARILLERASQAAQPMSAAQIRGTLDAGTLLVEFVSLPGETLVFALDRDAMRLVTAPLKRDALRRMRDELQTAARRDDTAAAKRAGDGLYAALLQPVAPEVTRASRLVFVTDDVTAAIPFAALYDARRGRYLIEEMPVVHAPSASTFAENHRRERRRLQAMVVGDPAAQLGSVTAVSLPQLPAARAEARDVARLYGTSALTGDDATPERIAAAAPAFDVLHFAVHALSCRFDPAQSALALSGTARADGLLSVRQIAALKLHRRPVVVLAGCRTAVSSQHGGTLQSLASAFIAAGGSSVVGTLWDIDDATARQLSLRFHERLARGATASAALREAQLELLQSPSQRSLSTWAAFEVLGTEF